jgi:hypothetical protein
MSGPTAAKLPSDHIPLGGFVLSTARQPEAYPMISSSARRGSKHRAQKPCSSPSDLAERFLELQRLRKQVYELEKAEAGGRQQSGGARTDLGECQK